MGEGDDAGTAEDGVHEVDEGALSRGGEAKEEDADDGRDVGVLLRDPTGGEPEVSGAVGEELVAEVVEGLVGDQREALQLLDDPEPRSEGGKPGGGRGRVEAAAVELDEGPPPVEAGEGCAGIVAVAVAASRGLYGALHIPPSSLFPRSFPPLSVGFPSSRSFVFFPPFPEGRFWRCTLKIQSTKTLKSSLIVYP